MSKPNLLARIFGRSEKPNGVVSSLYSSAIGRPLLVHPQIGESLIGAYLSGNVEDPGSAPAAVIPVPIDASSPPARISIIPISGGLVSRPTPGPCGPGPLSYEEIGESIEMAVDDASIDAIVLRIDSPGGMASQLFDLTDKINLWRNIKPIWAVVDDMAYSAAYGIAAACDRIWVTRTGGVGSVGVVAYHVDQSGADAQAGIKVTAIYAGSHKTDFSPYEPLTDDAKARAQEDIDVLYNIFTRSVAEYRGLDEQAVKATEALCFTGAAAVAVGFATDLGTFSDAIAALVAPALPDEVPVEEAPVDEIPAEEIPSDDEIPNEDIPEEIPEDAPEDVPADEQDPEEENKKLAAVGLKNSLRLAQFSTAVNREIERVGLSLNKNDVKVLTESSLSGKLSDIPARVNFAEQVSKLCELAGKYEMVGKFIGSSMTVKQVQAKLIEAKADESDKVKIDSSVEMKEPKAPSILSAKEIYEARKASQNPKINKGK